jgi:hypothetical protein
MCIWNEAGDDEGYMYGLNTKRSSASSESWARQLVKQNETTADTHSWQVKSRSMNKKHQRIYH